MVVVVVEKGVVEKGVVEKGVVEKGVVEKGVVEKRWCRSRSRLCELRRKSSRCHWPGLGY